MECNAVCQGIGQFLGNAFLWVFGVLLAGCLIVVVGVVRSIGSSISASNSRLLHRAQFGGFEK